MNLKGIFENIKDELYKIKDSQGLENLKYIDKKILIPAIVFVVVLCGFYYYYLFFVYPSDSKPAIPPKQAIIQDNAIEPPPISSFGNTELQSEEGKGIDKLLNDFFWCISNKEFNKAYSYFNQKFLRDNNITLNQVQKYFEYAYPPSINYQIEYISQSLPYEYYNVRIKVRSKDPRTESHYYIYRTAANYVLEKENDAYVITIPDMPAILKTLTTN